MKFCSQCGATVTHKIPEGDSLPRYVCESCDTIHYQNPRIIAGCIAEWQGSILLCKRAIEPRYGLWTLPAGFMENRETTAEGAAREALEEANANILKLSLFSVFSIPHISQVYMMFRGELDRGQASPGHESLEVGLFQEQDIPWDELAFPVIRETLKLYYADKHSGRFRTHSGDIVRIDDQLMTRFY
ncbi:MAG: NUDIX domain-containing protein [Gammaproteobacteria bacterium]|nr:MAG: NUDIX domain-containing protein [Gammaproteobacteria bacterium]